MDNNNNDNLDETKEITNIHDLSKEEVSHLDSEYESDFNEAQDEADLVFKTEIETKEEVKKEIKKEKKDNIFQKFKKLPKKNKIIIISVIVLVIIAIVVGIVLIVNSKKSNNTKQEDVILQGDNYRYENGNLIFLDSNDNEIGTYECTNKDQDKCMVAYLTNDDTMDDVVKQDEDGHELKLRSQIYFNRFVFIIDHASDEDKDIKVYDINAGISLKTVYSVTSYNENYVVLKDDKSRFGLEKITEDKLTDVIPYDYDYIGVIPNQSTIQYIAVRKDNNNYVSDLNNKMLTKAFNNPIVNANDKYVVTKDTSEKEHVYDYNATEVNKNTQEYVKLFADFMFSIQSNKLYVLDYEGHMMSPTPIDLNNDAYTTIEVYKDLKLDKTEKCFADELVDNILTIKTYSSSYEEDQTISINIYEGMLSSKLAYINYFNGILYFYSDANKQTLLGSYACANHNTVESGTTTLDNCKVGSDSFLKETTGNSKEVDLSNELGMIPIFNNQFVFIQDGNENIVLYDLKNKKSIAKYSGVDTSSYSNKQEVSFASADQIPYIGISKSTGNYGVANITSDGVQSVISFENKSIKGLGDYYVVETSSGYSLYNKTGSKVTNDFSSPIVDYHGNYLKTYKDNSYFVHGFKEDLNNSNAYSYIELYDAYFAAVNNNKLYIYNYTDSNTPLKYKDSDGKCQDSIALQLNNYNGSGTKAFRLTFDNANVYVEVGTSSGYQAKVAFTTKESCE